MSIPKQVAATPTQVRARLLHVLTSMNTHFGIGDIVQMDWHPESGYGHLVTRVTSGFHHYTFRVNEGMVYFRQRVRKLYR